MGLLSGIILQIFSNAIAILAASYFIAEFDWTGNFIELVIAAAILTLINKILKPIAKLFFGPLILITFGLFLLIINAGTLYLLDFWIEPLKVQGLIPLLLGTLIVGVVNFLVGTARRSKP